jgi:calmodulin
VSDVELDLAKQIFNHYDKDGNGTLDSVELSKFMADLGEPLNDAELDEALKILDKNGDGKIQIEEFLSWWQR